MSEEERSYFRAHPKEKLLPEKDCPAHRFIELYGQRYCASCGTNWRPSLEAKPPSRAP